MAHVGSDAAEDSEDRLDQERRPYQARIDEISEVIKVADIVALMLESGAGAYFYWKANREYAARPWEDI